LCTFCSTSEHGHAVRIDLAHDVEHLVGHARAQAQAGLVQQQQPGLGHQRAADGQHLLLAAAEGAGQLPVRSFSRGKRW
jgi:hypothetical protein